MHPGNKLGITAAALANTVATAATIQHAFTSPRWHFPYEFFDVCYCLGCHLTASLLLDSGLWVQ
ncbi:Uncharacterised protein [Mycobacteroides abscessus subsp. abscessus]|nr:Uncharacterised protein [Mycobacteroides abscessus subsp. abscessus]